MVISMENKNPLLQNFCLLNCIVILHILLIYYAQIKTIYNFLKFVIDKLNRPKLELEIPKSKCSILGA
jgi:hypothetical protein